MNKPYVGQRMFARVFAGRNQPMRETWATVTKVGRLYFSARFEGARNEEEFVIESRRRKGCNLQANRPIYLYDSEQHARDSMEAGIKARELSDALRYNSDWSKLSLQDLRTVHSIVFTNQKEQA